MNFNQVVFEGAYPVNVTPRIEADGSLFFYDTSEGTEYRRGDTYHTCILPARDAAMTARNMLDGLPWFAASPVMDINRRVAAFCFANAETIIKRARQHGRCRF